MNTRSNLFRLALVGSLGLGTALVAHPALARSHPGGTSYIAFPIDMPCLALSFGYATLTQTCASRTISVDFPLTIDSPGNWGVNVSVNAPATSDDVECRPEGLNEDASWAWYGEGGTYRQNTVLGNSTIAMPASGIAWGEYPTYVPAGGVLVLNCKLQHGARINTINWNPI